MSSNWAIQARHLGKAFQLYERPIDRLKQMLMRGRRRYYKEFAALHDVSFELQKGEVLGLVGRNGAGKSTLLQLICGTLTPTAGTVDVSGRVAALLELGAGFNPEFTGRENIYFNAAILGLSQDEIVGRLEEIIAFADIGPFIDQPVKTYSSGMFVRLAFSVAVNVEPDILIIDEALSVGDGQFARKSFDRIMRLKDAGKTILFCSHSMYQVEALCNRALWLDKGNVCAVGTVSEVIRAYSTFLDGQSAGQVTNPQSSIPGERNLTSPQSLGNEVAQSRLEKVVVTVDGSVGAIANSGNSEVKIEFEYRVKTGEVPSLAVAFFTLDGRCIASSGSFQDNVKLIVDGNGRGRGRCTFPKFPLLRGEYSVAVWLLCDRALFVHEEVQEFCRIKVEQIGLEQGVVTLPHVWEA
jgi:lipopolysaccharide transport system ATP-binding protein